MNLNIPILFPLCIYNFPASQFLQKSPARKCHNDTPCSDAEQSQTAEFTHRILHSISYEAQRKDDKYSALENFVSEEESRELGSTENGQALKYIYGHKVWEECFQMESSVVIVFVRPSPSMFGGREKVRR